MPEWLWERKLYWQAKNEVRISRCDRHHSYFSSRADQQKFIFVGIHREQWAMKYLWIVSIILVLSIHGTYSASFSTIRRQLKQATLRFLQSLEQENCAHVILNETVRDQYLSKKLIGRVQPVGTFQSTEAALEYLYGVSCQIPNVPVRVEVIDAVTLLQIPVMMPIVISFHSKFESISYQKRDSTCMECWRSIGDSNYVAMNRLYKISVWHFIFHQVKRALLFHIYVREPKLYALLVHHWNSTQVWRSVSRFSVHRIRLLEIMIQLIKTMLFAEWFIFC